VSLLFLGLLSGCGATPTVSPIDQEGGASQRLATLVELDRRVTEAGFRLSLANVDLCPTVAPRAGWLLHAANQYTDDLRAEAEQQFDLEGALPGISVVVPGSPAEAAGLRVGDLITAVDGELLDAARSQTRPGYEDLERNLARLDAAAMDDGQMDLSVRGGGVDRAVQVIPISACAYDTQVDPSPDIRARADGRRIFISSAFAAYAATEAELAFVLAHELAHNILDHPRQMGGLGLAPWRIEALENTADRVGLFLMARAGYEVHEVPSFLRRLGQDHWQLRYPQWGHASAGARARSLETVVTEIDSRRSQGLALTP